MTCFIFNIHSTKFIFYRHTVFRSFNISTPFSLSPPPPHTHPELFAVCLCNKMTICSLGSSEQFTAPLHLHRNAPGHFQTHKALCKP